MKYNRGQAALNREQLAAGLNRLSFNLNKEKALDLAQALLKGRQFIPVSELLELLQCVEDDIGQSDSWMDTMLRRVKVKMMSKGDPRILHDIFEKFDVKNQGVLSVGNFKTCFL